MLSTGAIAIILASLALLIALMAIYDAGRALRDNPRRLSLAKLAEHDTALTELMDSYDALLKSHKKLRSRIGMRENRLKKNDEDPTSDDWKTQMRQRLVSEGKLNSRFHNR